MDNDIHGQDKQINLIDFNEFFKHPIVYKGLDIEFTGQVFVEPDWDQEGFYIQVFTKPHEFSQNVLVQVMDTNVMVKANDYVHIEGEVIDILRSENMIGKDLFVPVIRATTIKVANYITATYPTLKSIYVNKSQEQHDFEISVEKVEFAKEQTRVYVHLENKSEHTASLFSYHNKLITQNEELHPKFIYNPVLPELQNEILPQDAAEGVLFFPAIRKNVNTFTIYIESSFANNNVQFVPFTFEVNVYK